MRRDLRNNQIRIFLRKNVIAITHNFKFLDNIEIDRDNEEDLFVLLEILFFLYLSKSITVELRKWEIGRVCRRLLTKKQFDKRAF